MAEVLLFHHAQGLTPGVVAFADELRAAGHTVHTPDLYDGNTFTELDDGMGYARQVGFETIMERGKDAADELPNEIVYGGFSLGYNLSVSAFGGTAPFLVTLLAAQTGNNASPALYIMAAAVITLVVIYSARETAPARLSTPARARAETATVGQGAGQGASQGGR